MGEPPLSFKTVLNAKVTSMMLLSAPAGTKPSTMIPLAFAILLMSILFPITVISETLFARVSLANM